MTSPRPETLNRLTDIVFDKVMRTLRTPDKNAPLYELLSEMMSRLDTELDLPLRLSATTPSSTKLLIRANRVLSGDGGQRSLPPDGVDFLSFPDTTIDFDNGSVSGGTIKRDGLDWSVPLVTVGQFVRVGFAYNAAENWVDTTFSSASVTLGALTDPGVLLDALTGTKIGYIDLESDGVSSFKTPNSVSGYIENAVSGVPYIFRFLSGGGTGTGTGDASTIRTALENQLQESTYDLLTAVDFAIDEDAFVDLASTGIYSNRKFVLAVSGDTFESINLFDASEYLADPTIPSKIDITAFWDALAIDADAVYEVSRDGGVDWQTVSGMERVGVATNGFVGTHIFDYGTDSTFTSNTAAQTSGYEMNSTSQTTYQDSFAVLESSVIRRVQLLNFVKTGSPVGNLYVDICADNGGNPGNVLATSSGVAVSGLSSGTVTIDVSEAALVDGTYWVVVRTDAVYKSSFSAGVTSVTLSLNANGLRGNYQGYVLDLRLRITSANPNVNLTGFGVFYMQSIGTVQGGSIKKDTKIFRTTENLNEFTLNFIADPDLLKCYHIETGQVYHHPAFALSGSDVTFPVNTFQSISDEQVTLLFLQVEGSSFDNSDLNAALLAANFLGSTDTLVDRSSSGRGIFLRRPDGTLREITIDNSDNIAVYSV
jgi:hypothetical protein